MMTPFAIDSFEILRGLISQLHISLLRIVGLRFLLAWRQLLSVRPKFSDQRVQICREFTSILVLLHVRRKIQEKFDVHPVT